MSALPQYWMRTDELDAGPFKLVTLAGYDIGGDPKNRHVLMVVESMMGYLTEAFSLSDRGGGVWKTISKVDAKAMLDTLQRVR